MDSSARKILQKGTSCRTMSPVQLPRQLQTLDDLLAQAMLNVKGIKAARSTKVPRLPRGRR